MPSLHYSLLFSLAKSKAVANHQGKTIYYNAKGFAIEIIPTEKLPGNFSLSAFNVAMNIVRANPNVQTAMKHNFPGEPQMLEAAVAIANKILQEYKVQLPQDENRARLEAIWGEFPLS